VATATGTLTYTAVAASATVVTGSLTYTAASRARVTSGSLTYTAAPQVTSDIFDLYHWLGSGTPVKANLYRWDGTTLWSLGGM
jgi:hypothetical protein